MWRLMHLFSLAVLIVSAVYVYTIKYQTILEAEEIGKVRHTIAKTEEDIAVLRAEYAHLARPERIQSLAEQLLQYQPLRIDQIARPQDIMEAAKQGDKIGDALQTLDIVPKTSPGAR